MTVSAHAHIKSSVSDSLHAAWGVKRLLELKPLSLAGRPSVVILRVAVSLPAFLVFFLSQSFYPRHPPLLEMLVVIAVVALVIEVALLFSVKLIHFTNFYQMWN